MPGPSDELRRLSRRDPAVARVLRDWRVLTGAAGAARAGRGAEVLIACSGGADSSALALSLASTGRKFTLGHVVHDMRGRAEAEADAAAVEELAGKLGFEFVRAEVRVRGERGHRFRKAEIGGTNLEAAARGLRYEALADMAFDLGVRFVATGHTATDQLETLVMGLLRGSAVRGMGGVSPRRLLARDFSGEREKRVWAVRPMLGVTRAECERVCREAGWAWREDATNADETRLRSAVRHRVLPVLRELRPGCEGRAEWTARLMRSAGGVLTAAAVEMCEEAEREEGFRWTREELRRAPLVVAGEALRLAAGALAGDEGADRLGRRRMEAVLRAVRDRGTQPREFDWGRVRVRVEARWVVCERSGRE